MLKKIMLLFLSCALLLTIMSSCNTQGTSSSVSLDTSQQAEECEGGMKIAIEYIYINHSGMGETFPEYLIDLKDRKFWVYTIYGSARYTPRDESAENEGYYFVKDLEQDKIAVFLEASEKYGFEEWEEIYEPDDEILDGDRWFVLLTYSDGTEKRSRGVITYPETWVAMGKAFENLTGTDVLEGKPPKPTSWTEEAPVY